jgi:hypothetical protein
LNSGRLRLLLSPEVDLEQEAEFFVWLRGPYRNLGIGTQALRDILQEIEADSAFVLPPETPLQRLTVYYPLQAAGSGGRLELERWMNFFFDQEFRRIKQPGVGIGARFAVLQRELNP